VLEIAPKVSSKKLKKLKKEEREKTKGKEWFDMAAPELTPELQNELDILKMRSAIDPTRFYKKSDATTQSKYFQVLPCFTFSTVNSNLTNSNFSRLVTLLMPQQTFILIVYPRRTENGL